jgi:hypothetical protein
LMSFKSIPPSMSTSMLITGVAYDFLLVDYFTINLNPFDAVASIS